MTDRRNLLLTVAVVGTAPNGRRNGEVELAGLKRPWRRPVLVFFFKCLLKERPPCAHRVRLSNSSKRLWGEAAGQVSSRQRANGRLSLNVCA